MTIIELITQAFRKANIIALNATPSAGQAAEGLAELNRMMAAWEARNINLQYYTQTDTTANFPCEEYTQQGVIGSLAAAIAPNYGRQLSVETLEYIREGMNTITNKIIAKQMRPADLRNLPRGSGRQGYKDITRG